MICTRICVDEPYRRNTTILFNSILIIQEQRWLHLRSPYEKFDDNEYIILLSHVNVFHNVSIPFTRISFRSSARAELNSVVGVHRRLFNSETTVYSKIYS
jgi:hypothetical protein